MSISLFSSLGLACMCMQLLESVDSNENEQQQKVYETCFSSNPGSDGIICMFRINMGTEFGLASFVEFIHLWKKTTILLPGKMWAKYKKACEKTKCLLYVLIVLFKPLAAVMMAPLEASHFEAKEMTLLLSVLIKCILGPKIRFD